MEIPVQFDSKGRFTFTIGSDPVSLVFQEGVKEAGMRLVLVWSAGASGATPVNVKVYSGTDGPIKVATPLLKEPILFSKGEAKPVEDGSVISAATHGTKLQVWRTGGDVDVELTFQREDAAPAAPPAAPRPDAEAPAGAAAAPSNSAGASPKHLQLPQQQLPRMNLPPGATNGRAGATGNGDSSARSRASPVNNPAAATTLLTRTMLDTLKSERDTAGLIRNVADPVYGVLASEALVGYAKGRGMDKTAFEAYMKGELCTELAGKQCSWLDQPENKHLRSLFSGEGKMVIGEGGLTQKQITWALRVWDKFEDKEELENMRQKDIRKLQSAFFSCRRRMVLAENTSAGMGVTLGKMYEENLALQESNEWGVRYSRKLSKHISENCRCADCKVDRGTATTTKKLYKEVGDKMGRRVAPYPHRAKYDELYPDRWY